MNIGSIGSTSLSSILSSMTNRMQKPSSSDMAASIIGHEDKDQNGTISASETKLDSERFGKIDTDGNGQLTSEEIEASFQTFEADRAQRMVGPQGGPPPEPPKTEDVVSSILGQQDADGNGVLSAEEAGLDSDLFSSIDTDGSGTLSSEELTAKLEANKPQPPQQSQAAGSSGSDFMSDENYQTLMDVLAQNEASSAYSDQSWLYSFLQSSEQSLAVSA